MIAADFQPSKAAIDFFGTDDLELVTLPDGTFLIPVWPKNETNNRLRAIQWKRRGSRGGMFDFFDQLFHVADDGTFELIRETPYRMSKD